MMKKGKVVLAQPAAGMAPRMMSPRPPPPPVAWGPAPVRGGGEDPAYVAGLRYRGLLHDYRELAKETEAKKRRLRVMKLQKQRLLAEVKFLRERYKSMSENPSQTVVCRLKNRSMPPPTSRTTPREGDVIKHRPVPIVGSSSKSLPVQRRQLGPPMASPVIDPIDLNEACEPSHEEIQMAEYHGYQEPLGINNTRRYALEGNAAAGPSGVRMNMFWDIRSPAEGARKRKISYQDQLLLGV